MSAKVPSTAGRLCYPAAAVLGAAAAAGPQLAAMVRAATGDLNPVRADIMLERRGRAAA